jgi:hypothetical protein
MDETCPYDSPPSPLIWKNPEGFQLSSAKYRSIREEPIKNSALRFHESGVLLGMQRAIVEQHDRHEHQHGHMKECRLRCHKLDIRYVVK